MTGVDKRGEYAAIIGCVLSLVAAGLLLLLGLWSDSSAAWAAGFMTLGGVGIWFVTWLQIHQHRLIAEERLEVDELERVRQERLGGTQTIFDEEDLDQMEKLSMGRRLRSIERFFVPVVALGVGAYYAIA